MSAADGAAEGETDRRFPWKLVGVAVVVVGLVLLGRRASGSLAEVLEAVEGLGPWAAVAFVGLYAGATVAWVPGSLLTLAAGAIFGLVEGTLYTLAGATLGAALAFLVARYLARSAVEARLGGHRKLQAIDEALGREGAKVVFLVRLSPVFPFNALNYALGLTRVGFRDYVLASAVGMIPGTFLYVYAGYTAGRIAADAAGVASRSTGYYVLLGAGLLATVAVTVLVTRTARRALARRSALDEEAT